MRNGLTLPRTFLIPNQYSLVLCTLRYYFNSNHVIGDNMPNGINGEVLSEWIETESMRLIFSGKGIICTIMKKIFDRISSAYIFIKIYKQYK